MFCDLSVLIIAKNEEHNLGRCIESLPKGSQIIVVDAQSEDQTRTVAEQLGAQVFVHEFKDYSDQRNFSIKQATRSWLLFIDADEKLSSELCFKITQIVEDSKNTGNLYYLRRDLIYMNHRMKFSNASDLVPRLVHRSMSPNFKGVVHEKLETTDNVCPVYLKSTRYAICHYAYRDIDHHIAKALRYAKMIAEQKAKSLKKYSAISIYIRSKLNFLKNFVFKLGFLDGYPGFVFASISQFYTFLKYSYTNEEVELLKKNCGE